MKIEIIIYAIAVMALIVISMLMCVLRLLRKFINIGDKLTKFSKNLEALFALEKKGGKS